MKITKVSYARTFPTGPYMNEKIGLEADVDELIEKPEYVLIFLKQMAEDFHKKANPHLYQDTNTYPAPYDGRDTFHTLTSGQLTPTEVTYGPLPTISVNEEVSVDDIEAEIYCAKSIEELSSYKILASSGNPKLYVAYNTRMEMLRIEENNKLQGKKNQIST